MNREDIETMTYYALLEALGEETAQRIETHPRYAGLIDQVQARSGWGVEELTEFVTRQAERLL